MARKFLYTVGFHLLVLCFSSSKAQEAVFECGNKATCVSFPSSCKPESCELLVDVERKNDNLVSFHVMGKVDASGYVAIGLSKDSQMGQDAVIACFSDGVKTFINPGQPGDHAVSKPQEWKTGAPQATATATVNGRLTCSFDLPNKVDAGQGISFDLSQGSGGYSVLLVGGTATPNKFLTHHSRQTSGALVTSSVGPTNPTADKEGPKSMATSVFGSVSLSCFVILSSIVSMVFYLF